MPPGAPPTKAELANLITGTGPAVNGDTFTVEYVLADYSSRKVIQSSWTSTLSPAPSNRAAFIPGWVREWWA